MEKKTRQNCCQLKVYPNSSKMSKKSGLLPFYVKLTYQKKKVEFRLYDEYDVKAESLKHWDSKNECLMSNDSRYDDVNIKIGEIKLGFKKYMRKHNNMPDHSLNEIMSQILGIKKVDLEQTTIKYIDDYYNQTIVNSNVLAKGTKVNYLKAINHFKKFCCVYGYNNMLLTGLKYEDARKFQTWMGSKDGANNLPSSASGIIKNLKHILGEAVKCDLIIKNPFADLKLNHKCSSHTNYLTIDQVKKIIDFQTTSNNKDLKFYKDLFLFSCFTGLSVCDVHDFSKDALLPVFDGRSKIDTSRKKTGKVIIQIIPKLAQLIIEKYSGMDRLTVFPKFCPYTYNKKLN